MSARHNQQREAAERRTAYTALNRFNLTTHQYDGSILFSKGKDTIKVMLNVPRTEVVEDGKTEACKYKTFADQRKALSEQLLMLSL